MPKTEIKTGIHAKLLAIQGELPAAPKNGFNSFHKYKYVTETDVLSLVNPLCTRHGMSHYINQLEAHIDRDTATVKVELVVHDIESGEELRATSWGYAQDMRGDKAVYKAITGATKYAYLKFFGLSTGDDPENETAPTETPALKRPPYTPTHKAGQEAKAFTRQAILKKIGMRFQEHGFGREDFAEVEAIQDPESASLEALEDALALVEARSPKAGAPKPASKTKTGATS